MRGPLARSYASRAAGPPALRAVAAPAGSPASPPRACSAPNNVWDGLAASGLGALAAPAASLGSLGAGIALRRSGVEVDLTAGHLAVIGASLPFLGGVFSAASGDGSMLAMGLVLGPPIAAGGSILQLMANERARKAHYGPRTSVPGPSVSVSVTPIREGAVLNGSTGSGRYPCHFPRESALACRRAIVDSRRAVVTTSAPRRRHAESAENGGNHARSCPGDRFA